MPLTSEREKIAHLLRRFGLGASEAEISYYGRSGLGGAITGLLDYENVDDPHVVPISAFQNQDNKRLVPRALQSWWVLRFAVTHRPLQEKMTLFWHDHFATSSSKVNQAPMMYVQNEILRKNATGNFRTLLTETSKDPAMLFWLDNQFNVRGKPNENFAREIMELFTLGIGHYTEKDIQEAARAFTGWTIARRRPKDLEERPLSVAEFINRPALHDAGRKTILGNTGNWNGDDVVSILCANPQTARYIATKVWEWFAYSDPEKSVIDKITKKFVDSDLEIKVLLRAVMESAEFYSEKAERSVFKNPIDFTVPPIRQLGFGELIGESLKGENLQARRGKLAPVVALQQSMNAMGMDLLYPPDVAGWDHGPAWITSATMVERIGFAKRLFGVVGNAGAAPGRDRVAVMRIPVWTLFEKDPSPAGFVRTLLSILDAPIPAQKHSQLEAAATKVCGSRATAENASATASAVCRLIFGSPEFQMA